jgi:hypothetical protein
MGEIFFNIYEYRHKKYAFNFLEPVEFKHIDVFNFF